MNTETPEKYQRQLLEQSRRIHHKTPISQAAEQAYFAMPRHLFVSRYREWGSTEWRQVEKVRQWVELGMPTAASFKLQVHPNDYPVGPSANEWLVKRGESTFLWSLEA